MKKLLTIFPIAALLLSCHTHDFGADHTTAHHSSDDPVTLERALDGMFSTINTIYGENTRAAQKSVSGVTLFSGATGQSRQNPKTRSGNLRDLAYVVNFAEGGFAVLGARESVPEVICITESGLFEPGEVEKISSEIASGTLSKPVDIVDFIKREVLLHALDADEKVQRQIAANESQWTRSLTRANETYVWTDWTDAYKTGPLLKTLWNQSFPYNQNCPPDPRDARQTSYTGCVATALSQIIAHNESPAPQDIVDGVTSTWADIKEHYHNPSKTSIRSTRDAQLEGDLAKITHAIGLGVDMDYSYFNGSAASSSKAEAYLRDKKFNVNYKNVQRWIWYNSFYFTDMHDRGLPTYVSAAGDGGAHAWVVDGSVHQKRTRNASDGTHIERRFMLHCNFGWGGTANGYYLSETFSPDRGPVDTETGVDAARPGSNGRWYNSQYQIIEYSL